MNGIKLTQEFLDFCNQTAVDEAYASQRKIYDCLDMAAGIYCRETRTLRNSFRITTVPGQQNYNLPPDFIDMFMQDSRGRFFVKYSDGTNTTFPILDSYDRLYLDNYIDNQDFPSYFALIDTATQPTLITGTATAAGTATNGRCILADNTKHFLTTNLVYPRDIIYNSTDQSLGIVLAVIDDTHLYCALFAGTDNDWTDADAYTIQPSSKKTLVLAMPALTAGYTIDVVYVCMPAPVYWDFAAWNFPDRTCQAIASGGASLFKIGKTEYKESQSLGALFDSEVKQYKIEMGRMKLQQGPSRRRERM